MSFTSNTTMIDTEPFFEGWVEILRYFGILRFLMWLLTWVRFLIGKRKDDNQRSNARARTPLPMSSNEFGYIDMNGAY